MSKNLNFHWLGNGGFYQPLYYRRHIDPSKSINWFFFHETHNEQLKTSILCISSYFVFYYRNCNVRCANVNLLTAQKVYIFTIYFSMLNKNVLINLQLIKSLIYYIHLIGKIFVYKKLQLNIITKPFTINLSIDNWWFQNWNHLRLLSSGWQVYRLYFIDSSSSYFSTFL